MPSFMESQSVKAKEVQEVIGQHLVDLSNEAKARVETIRTILGSTPEEIAENQSYKPAPMLPTPDRTALDTAKAALDTAIAGDRDPYLGSYEGNLVQPQAAYDAALADYNNRMAAYGANRVAEHNPAMTLSQNLSHRYGNVFEGKNKKILQHFNGPEAISFPTKYEDLKKSLGYDLSKPIPPREREMLQSKDMDKALSLYNSATTPEQKDKALKEYNYARSARALAFMEPREQAIAAKQPLTVHYPIEEKIQVNPRAYQGQWFADQPAELTQGNAKQAEASQSLVDNTKAWRKESDKLYRELNGKAPLSGIANQHLDTLKEDVSPRVNQLMNKHARSLIDSPTYNRFVEQADRKMEVVRRKANETLEEQIQAMRGHYSASGTHSGGIVKQERLMRQNAAQRLEDTYRDMLDSAQGRGIEAAQRERGHQAHLADLYRSSRGQENQGQLNVAQQKVANETQEQQLKHYNLAHKHRAGLAHNTALADQGVALQSIGTRNQTNDQNRVNALKNQHLHNTGDMDNHRLGLIQAAHAVPMAPSYQASATTPAMPAQVSHSSQAGTLFAAASNGLANMLQAQQQQTRPQVHFNLPSSLPFAAGGHVQGRPSSDDLLKAYHGQLEAYEKAARRYQQQHEDYLPTGLRQAGDAFLGVAKGASEGNSIGGFVEGMEKGQKHHDQYMNRGRERELRGMELEGNITKGKGSAWKDLAGHENELKRMNADELYKNAHLGIERERLDIERQKIDAANKRATQSAMLRQKGMRPVFDEEGNIVGTEKAPRVLNAKESALEKQTLAELDSSYEYLEKASFAAATASHLPDMKYTSNLYPKIAGALSGPSGSTGRLDIFNTNSNAFATLAGTKYGAKNMFTEKQIAASKVNSEISPQANEDAARTGAHEIRQKIKTLSKTLKTLGYSDDEIEEVLESRDIHTKTNLMDRLDHFSNTYKEKARPEMAKKIISEGERVYGGYKGGKESSNFKQPEPVTTQVQEVQAIQQPQEPAPLPMPVNTSDGDGPPSPPPSNGEQPIVDPFTGGTSGVVPTTEQRAMAMENEPEPIKNDDPYRYAKQAAAWTTMGLTAAPIGRGIAMLSNPAAKSLVGKGFAKATSWLGDQALAGQAVKDAIKKQSVAPLARVGAYGAAGGLGAQGLQDTGMSPLSSDFIGGTLGGLGAGLLESGGKRILNQSLPGIKEYVSGHTHPYERHLKKFLGREIGDDIEKYVKAYAAHESKVPGYKATAPEIVESTGLVDIPMFARQHEGSSPAIKNQNAQNQKAAAEHLDEIKAPELKGLREKLNESHTGEKQEISKTIDELLSPEAKEFPHEVGVTLRKGLEKKSEAVAAHIKKQTEPLYKAAIDEHPDKLVNKNFADTFRDLVNSSRRPETREALEHYAGQLNIKNNSETKKVSLPENTAIKTHSILKAIRDEERGLSWAFDKELKSALQKLGSSLSKDMKNQIPKFEHADQVYKEVVKDANLIHGTPALNNPLLKNEKYEHRFSDEAIVDPFLSGKSAYSNSKKLVQSLGQDHEEVAALRDYGLKQIFDTCMTKGGTLNVDKLNSWLAKNRGFKALDPAANTKLKNLAANQKRLIDKTGRSEKDWGASDSLTKEGGVLDALRKAEEPSALLEEVLRRIPKESRASGKREVVSDVVTEMLNTLTENGRKALTPHNYLKYVDKNNKLFKSVLDKESLSKIDAVTKAMEERSFANTAGTTGQSITEYAKRFKEGYMEATPFDNFKNFILSSGLKQLPIIKEFYSPHLGAFKRNSDQLKKDVFDKFIMDKDFAEKVLKDIGSSKNYYAYKKQKASSQNPLLQSYLANLILGEKEE